MKILSSSNKINGLLSELKKKGNSIGFVPTMGALHNGHMALVKKAKAENDILVCSIYVNPLQFNNKSDFSLYPREIEKDLFALENAGCDLVFCPDDSIVKSSESFQYDIGFLDSVMEGHYRPGHFKGVAYIVKALFEILIPDKAYFGLKDYQQLAVVKKMVKDFSLPVKIIPCPTVRESTGLAMSSRNERLTNDDKSDAAKIYEGLKIIKEKAKIASVEELKNKFKEDINKHPQMNLEYIEICDAETLKPINNWSDSQSCVACVSVYFQNVRLIDNVILF